MTSYEIAFEVAKSLAADSADPIRLQADARQILRRMEQLGVTFTDHIGPSSDPPISTPHGQP